jgi:hypothetical protein
VITQAMHTLHLPSLVDLLNRVDLLRIQGKPRVEIEKNSWNAEEPYYTMTAVGTAKDLRSVWCGEEKGWQFQKEGEKRLDQNFAKRYASITDAYLDSELARSKHPNYKPPVEGAAPDKE